MKDKGRMLKGDGHLTDDWLLLAIDGELSTQQHAAVKDHVRACWWCRARRERFEKTIKEIVAYEQALIAPDMPPDPGSKAIFMARLHQISNELGSPASLRVRVFHLLCPARLPVASRAALVFASAVLMAAVIFYAAFGRHTPVVSASQLLDRAADNEANAFAGEKHGVSMQRLTIITGGRKLTRTLYRDSTQQRLIHRTDARASDEGVVERNFNRSTLRWDDPLSAQSFRQWRDGVAQKKDVVTQLSGGLLRLDTTAASGPIAEASLTVRENDYHAVAEDLSLRDNTRIEVAELSYEVAPRSILPPAMPGALSPEKAVLPSVASPSIHAVLPDARQLAAAELEVRTILHQVGADMGEQISIHSLPNGLIQVEGVAQDEPRIQEIDTALRHVQHTRVRILTVAQAAAHSQPEHSLSAANSITLIAPRPPLLEDQLKKRFPANDQRQEYVNQALSLCQSASARAWALNRLADRYTPSHVAWLDADAQHQLQSLLSDHTAALREDVSRLQNQLGQVLSSASNTAVANTDTSSGIAAASDDWRSRVHRVHSSVEITNETVSALLAGSSESSDSPDKLELRLRTTLTQLQAELSLLDQQIHKQL